MANFAARKTPADPDEVAPDKSEVRLLAQRESCGMADFRLPAGTVSPAVEHCTVDGIWYVLSGTGEMWRSQEGHEEITPLDRGLSLTIPVGTEFQFPAGKGAALRIVGLTIPRWPGAGEARLREGHWP